MTKPAVLIVGAGATGLPVGYHLALAGAEVTFLVRPGRAGAFAAPQRLYCYDDAELKMFEGYDVVEHVGQLADRTFQFVLITLDGHASRSTEGAAMLRDLGDAIRPTGATVVMSAFGQGIRAHYLETLGLPEDRLLFGFLGMLSHQASAGLPLHPPTDATHVARAAICYRHPKNRVGFRVQSGTPAAKRFAALYDRSGVSRCARFGKGMAGLYSSIAFPVYAACDLADWADFATVASDKELWDLACRAQREITTLPEHGWRGRLLGAVMGPRMTKQVHTRTERDMLPLDYQAFNRFHHGGKVQAQDIRSLRDSLAEGHRQGRPMKALATLLARIEAHEANTLKA
ncbi:ketopantoate reductase family protein [Streptomyces sp. NPDC057623]|uniref:ketopantoate reductase family protein n=1 Tax=Streptomyces sp. NPDC057623 TaxID=3346187 RepID=UPI0036CAAF00